MTKIESIFILTLIIILVGCSSQKALNSSEAYINEIETLNATIDSLKNQIAQKEGYLSNSNFEPGKVYIQCPTGAQFITQDSFVEQIIYTGTNFDQNEISHIQIEVRPNYRKWIRLNSDSLCDMEYKDCMAWGYYEFPAEFESMYTVTDTNRIKDFRVELFEYRKLKSDGLLTKFRELQCPNVDYQTLPRIVQNALMSKGYKLEGHTENIFDEITKAALVDFQKKNGISVGQLDEETLKALGIQN